MVRNITVRPINHQGLCSSPRFSAMDTTMRFIMLAFIWCFIRGYDKSTAQMARHFYHDKFPLETCIFNAHSA